MASAGSSSNGQRPAAEAPLRQRRRALILGGGLAGLAAAKELRRQFRVTLVDAKEYFEFTSGVLRAYADPSHWSSLTFLYHEVLERSLGVHFIWGEATGIDSTHRTVRVRTMFARRAVLAGQEEEDVVPYDFCLVCIGCKFNQLVPTGESPWSPTIRENDRTQSVKSHLDERFLAGRRQRILEENLELQELNNRQDSADVLIVGAGFMGVEWACELRHSFPRLRITLCDFLPCCLGPLPDAAAKYCQMYMDGCQIRTKYGIKYAPSSDQFWAKVGLPNRVEKRYILSGVRSSNASNSNASNALLMPKSTLSDRGPGGGGWIIINRHLQVVTQEGKKWADGLVFAAGDCIVGLVGEAPKYEIPPMPKTGYSAEQQAVHACRNMKVLDREWFGGTLNWGCVPLPRCLGPSRLRPTWYPWGSGIYAISLGPNDGCIVVGANEEKGSGRLCGRGLLAAAIKEIIESTKVAHLVGDHCTSSFLWYLVHHWPCNLWGRGPKLSC